MKRVRHNLKFQWVKNPQAFQKALSLTLIYSLIFPSFVRAQDDDAPNGSTKSAITQHGSMQGALSVLTKLNQAMETAAQNPNDDWRRDEVRKAVQAVPSAVQSVASTFAANTMGNSALPFVLSTLGSAVDVNAPNSFDKHLKNPNPPAIERASEGASERKATVEELTYVVKEQARPETRNDLPSSDIAQMSYTSISQDTKVVPATEFSQIVRQKEAEMISEPLSTKVPPPSEVISSLHEDIAVAEAVIAGSVMAESDEIKKREPSSTDETEFFTEKAPKKDLKAKKPESKRAPAIKPTSWLLAPVFYLAQFENEAHAEQGQPGVGNPMNGSPTNPGDQNGGGAGQILFGIAAIIGAVAPMIVASQEAQSQQNIAQTQAQAQIQQAEIQTSTQKEMAQMSAQTALAQAQTQQQVAKMNNDAQTERLQINLAASQQQRNEQRQAEGEQLTLQRQLEAQKVALAMQKADQDILMARQSLEAQKLQMAASGSSPSSNANAATTAGSPIAAALAAQAVGESTTGTNSSNAVAGLRTTSAKSARGLISATNRLLASLDGGALSDAENIPAVRKVLDRFRGLRRGRGARKGFYQSGLSTLAAGSFAGLRMNNMVVQQQEQINTGVLEARRPMRLNQGLNSHSAR